MRRRRLMLLGAVLLVAVVVAATVAVDRLGAGKGASGARAQSAGDATTPATSAAASQATPRATTQATPESPGHDLRHWPAELILPSERSVKADLIEELGYAPQFVFFGGSRSTRFEPSYLTGKTGLKGFNLAMTNGAPEDALVFAHFLHDRSPGTRLRWIWGIQLSTTYEREFDPGLIQDPRLNRYLPDDVLRAEAGKLPQDVADMPAQERGKNRRWAPDGALLRNTYDVVKEKGRTLERALEVYTERALRMQREAPSASQEEASRSRGYFEATLGYLNEIGADPILVAMPTHPQVLEALRAEGWQTRQDRFLAYIDGLHERYDFEFIDLTDIESFGGDPDEFYDGVHITAANTRRVIDELLRVYPEGFEQ